jgi:hypothetical protein
MQTECHLQTKRFVYWDCQQPRFFHSYQGQHGALKSWYSLSDRAVSHVRRRIPAIVFLRFATRENPKYLSLIISLFNDSAVPNALAEASRLFQANSAEYRNRLRRIPQQFLCSIDILKTKHRQQGLGWTLL